eukprot:CAMPEP_0178762116 /NCGR_PEP_ID=MMETSP0744-20121128/16367_1 /TAXON_ID=913974 /ORGANISM="Nitzschia punctata, Strain CCMP561" /LENGTH=346 /DNA_ID=CAMNT_0020416765 /DNA_START=214 /DNA_END=1254 /DNA_ORIENTATION=+
MADAAAFFANKKKKKKAFKGFNANKIDAATVTNTVHVDAPALSTDTDTGSAAVANSLPVSSSADPSGADAADAQWDDEALAAATVRKGTAVAAPAGVTSKDWAEMKALDFKTTGNEQDDIAEKLRVEETRAQLAAAREGMEREAQRIKEEKEKKEQEAKEKTASRFGAAAAGLSSSAAGTGGKWVPSRLRAGGLSASERFGGVGGSTKLDTEDEELFPDLAAAEAIIEKQKQEQPAFKAPKKTPVGGGATWGSRPKLNLKPKSDPAKKQEEQTNATVETKEAREAPKEEVKVAAETASEAKETTPAAPAGEAAPAAAPTSTAAAPTAAPIKPKKKKKKDINTFGKK